MHMLLADIVWPALFLEEGIWTWWSILIGLFVEYFFVRMITDLSFWRTVWADVAMNTASTLLGIVLIPISGLLVGIFPGILFEWFFNVGTFNPVNWMATILAAALINTYIERFVLRKFFKQPVAGRRCFGLLFIANVLSITIAFGSLYITRPHDF